MFITCLKKIFWAERNLGGAESFGRELSPNDLRGYGRDADASILVSGTF